MNNYKGRDKGRGTGRDEGKSQERASPSLYYITSFFGLWKKIYISRKKCRPDVRVTSKLVGFS